MTRIVVYTCAIGDYDWILRPRTKPPGIDFLRFSDKKPWRLMGWSHRPLPQLPGSHSIRVKTRVPKLRPHDVLKDCDVAIWIDSSVEILGDIRPLVQQFLNTDTDIAMFPHPSGRSVAEEMEFAKGARRIPPELYEAADRQRARYAEAGVLDHKVVEATIIFYRLPSGILRAAGETWWHEITTYTERDQISQPFAMRDPRLRLHRWDWHFDEPNPYFRRVPHRPRDFIKRMRTGAHFLGDSRVDFRLTRLAIRAAGSVKRIGQYFRRRA